MSDKKILVIGDAGVGKTCFINKITNNPFIKQYINTTGIQKYVIDSTPNTPRIELYDYPGQEKHGITHLPEDISGCIIMYDVTNTLTYNSVKFWKETITTYYQNKLPLILVIGNKIDARNRKVTDLTTINLSVKKNTNMNIIKGYLQI